MFGNAKNLPQTEMKSSKPQGLHYSQQAHPQERPFSEPYNPQDDFDFTTLPYPQKYHFSLDPATVFPKGRLGGEEAQLGEFEMGVGEVPQVPPVGVGCWEEM
jgi:hypothetical protein